MNILLIFGSEKLDCREMGFLRRATTFFLFLLLYPLTTLADSPLTSTPFSDAYQEVLIIEKAASIGMLHFDMAQFLSSPSIPIDQKAALINALGWNVDGKSNAKLYRYYLSIAYQQTMAELDEDQLTADELFSLGYLTAMDDYFHPEKALDLLKIATSRKKESMTIAMIFALVQAQSFVGRENEWCKIWSLTDAVLKTPGLKRDLRPKAKDIIISYTRVYQDYCQ